MLVQKQGLHLPLYGEVPKLLVGNGTQFYQERVCAKIWPMFGWAEP